ncbi:PadR family transcriptional regulator (plasmid) [Kovacikia minuta CCNUW1]|uniref:PadR family transcriptional regulator n=1 Tax=Kovacikia minuta TaxID=2931930 RepID=UPI001CCC324E|nr:PadR family transcriptional regulator [Kovacikia minuta]UBF29825.1 PadR family transcriptional regulator [Kovacikia minuta CCNUW1]
MSLAHTILGLLQQQERTGYDLKTQCFDNCIAHLWQADQAQIYRTLDKLESQGWITCTIEIQHDRPNRKVYRITATGEAELIEWLQTHHPLPAVREPLLVQLHFAAQLPNGAIVGLLEQELATRRKKLAECEEIAAQTPNTPVIPREQKMHQLVLELAMRREQTYLDWLQDAIDKLNTQD